MTVDEGMHELDLDLGNSKARLRLYALGHVPQAAPEQLLWCGCTHCPVADRCTLFKTGTGSTHGTHAFI